MKKLRDYGIVCPYEDEPTCVEKTTFLLTDEEAADFADMLARGAYDEFERECRWMLNAYDMYSRFDGDRYEHYYFTLTSSHRLTLTHEWGYDI